MGKELQILLLSLQLPCVALAHLVGPYDQDTNTLVLLHLDEAAGSFVATNTGSLGGNFYSVDFSSNSTPLNVVNTVLGKPSFSAGSIDSLSFNRCAHFTSGYELAYDFNRNGVFEPDTGNGTSPDFIAMKNLNIGNDGPTPFTLEALILPTSLSGNQEIICTDSHAEHRGFQFRIASGTLEFNFIDGSQMLSAKIPKTGQNAFVTNAWFHVAFTYNGSVGTLYWTRLAASRQTASLLSAGILSLDASNGTITGPLTIGNRGRTNGTEAFLGNIDEVRVSNVARSANEMQFW